MILDDIKAGYRVGLGSDIHAFVPDRTLMLGGISIPYEAGLQGHSDGDVVLHAIMDALLGAAGLGDMTALFPETDPHLKDVDSKGLLLDVKDHLYERKWEIVNLDLTIHLERPAIGPYKGQIRRCVAGLLDIEFTSVNVKDKSNQGLDAVGRGEAIAASAIALIREKPHRTL